MVSSSTNITLPPLIRIKPKWLILILLQYLKAVFLVIFAIDPPLLTVISLGITPYGVLWYLLNWPITFFLNPDIWKVWLWILDNIICIFFISIKLKLRIYIPFQLTSLFFFEHGLANLSVLWFAVLGFINPIFIIISLCIKLPIGWSLNFNDIHVNQALYGHANDFNHLFTYAIIIFWWLYPTIDWFLRSLRKH